ncbi:hypothetical protein HYU23_03280 [Candidatus Woesearchaeota archaeon]|nr:hypothetical protein [Candidatus Woesearchaeota archaeon]
METLTIPKEIFSKILTDVEILIDDVERALDNKVKQRTNDLSTGKVKAKTEKDLDEYLIKRGIKVE